MKTRYEATIGWESGAVHVVLERETSHPCETFLGATKVTLHNPETGQEVSIENFAVNQLHDLLAEFLKEDKHVV